VEVRGDKVRVGIQASTDIPIFREEIWLERQAKKEEVTGE
jgi:sRNA-binding carbon storage regulator CsrA